MRHLSFCCGGGKLKRAISSTFRWVICEIISENLRTLKENKTQTQSLGWLLPDFELVIFINKYCCIYSYAYETLSLRILLNIQTTLNNGIGNTLKMPISCVSVTKGCTSIKKYKGQSKSLISELPNSWSYETKKYLLA